MNNGLSEELKAAFPKILPVPRPSVLDYKIKDPHWFAGFTTGEGCFFIKIISSSSHRLGFQVLLVFELTQHSRDEQLMGSLVDYLGGGNVYVRSNKLACAFQITSFTDLMDKVIPF